MDDAALKQWTDTLEVLSRARETGELLAPCARRALSRGVGKANVLREINTLREAILELDGLCQDCAKAHGEETEVGMKLFRLCADCAHEREIERQADAADRAYDAYRDGER